MLRSVGLLLQRAAATCSASSSTSVAAACSSRGFRTVVDFDIDFSNRETLKKYVGVRDHLDKTPGSKARLVDALNELLEEVKILPPNSDYRRAVEATCNYRLKVCAANTSDAAIEEVLDEHLEELIKEVVDEERLLPVMAKSQPWDVPEGYSVPFVAYHDAEEVLAKKK